MKNPLSKRVQIDVSLARPHSTREEYPRLVVFGIVPYGAPIISEIAPNSMIRRSSTTVDGPYVEQVRLSSILQGKLLPGLNQSSRLRDSLQSILTSGFLSVASSTLLTIVYLGFKISTEITSILGSE